MTGRLDERLRDPWGLCASRRALANLPRMRQMVIGQSREGFGMTDNGTSQRKIRPFFALWQFTKVAFFLAVAFYCAKLTYYIYSENPTPAQMMKAAAEKTDSAAKAVERLDKRINKR